MSPILTLVMFLSISDVSMKDTQRTLILHTNMYSESIINDVRALSEYYSQFPEVVELIKGISGKRWSLVYKPNTIRAEIKATRLSIDEVIVYFDPRLAVQAKFFKACDVKPSFCVTKPADALLHELIHVHMILNETELFIAQGGLSTVLYPYHHEYSVIKKENTLYKSMTAIDGKNRPQRTDHTGRPLNVSCVTCIE